MRTLRTSHLTMEPVGTGNARDMWRLLQRPHLRDFQDIPRLAYEELERQIRLRPKRLGRGGKGRFEWLLRAGNFEGGIGWVSLRINERSPHLGEIGYSLIVEARGQGYATEAVRALVDEVFTFTDLAEIQACCLPDNLPSRSLLARIGFRETRTIPGGAMVRGRRVNVVEHQLHRGEWTVKRRAGALRRPASRP
jgi:[ribosomal protein S5]-alanine N-acetyltransferase